MPQIEFTSQISGHVGCPSLMEVQADSLKAALDAVFLEHPSLREYLIDECGDLRRHITLFVDGEMVSIDGDRDQVVGLETEVLVMQAVAGG